MLALRDVAKDVGLQNVLPILILAQGYNNRSVVCLSFHKNVSYSALSRFFFLCLSLHKQSSSISTAKQ